MGRMELFVALRYLRGKKKIGFISWITYITAAGVFLGSFVLVVALSIANGFEKEVRDRIVGTLAHAKIVQYHGEPIVGYDSLARLILRHPEVEAAAPFITGKAGLECEKVQEGVMFIGIDDSLERTVSNLHTTIKWGSFRLDSTISDRDRKFPGILIGKGLADKLGIRDGAEVVLMSLAPSDDGTDPEPRMARFTVNGIFETGMYEYDLTLVYISIEAAQFLLNMHGVEGIQIKTVDLFKADRIAESVRLFLGGYPYRALDWKMQNRSLFQWMRLERMIIFIVISLIVVVAAFNIISSLIMIILEKRREIGILMSMGATSRAIMRIFMANGVIVGFIGSTLGVSLSVALCLAQYKWRFIPIPGDLYFINKLPVIVRPVDVMAVYITVNLICWLVTLYPAWKASSLPPAESIRYE